MTDSLIIFIPCSGLPLQVNADAQDSPKSMSELLPLFQPECVFSYATRRLAADGLSVSSLYAPPVPVNKTRVQPFSRLFTH
ncbi:hypothetical protein CDA56_21380 [Klebsiella michiganensis]|nr:hypothetical protein [Klebsiella michiganensis]POT80895.1 hypothetical protein C3378_03410 [Klebsiella michiganensis]PPA46383.1 hypothetical protein CDA56_21380 [Klebsiella michiganensis]